MQSAAFTTRDPERAHDYISKQYIAHTPVITGNRERFEFAASFTQSGPLRVDLMHHTMGVECQADPFEDLTSVFVRRGRKLIATDREHTYMRAGDVCLLPVGVGLHSAWTDVDLSLFRLPLETGARVAHEVSGLDERAFTVLSLRPKTRGLGQYWARLIRMVADQLEQPDSVMNNPLIAADTATMMARAMIRVFPTTADRAEATGPTRVESPAIRRAVAYIEEQADQPLTLSDIATAAGVGARALQIAFARHQGLSPMEYTRRIRLDRARSELKSADAASGVTVAGIARRWGFDSPSHFTAIYRETYGELPSRTLRS